jgi:hypothetical protein
MALSPPKASSAGLRLRQAANRDTAASTLIHTIVTVCKRWIRRIAPGEAICSTETIGGGGHKICLSQLASFSTDFGASPAFDETPSAGDVTVAQRSAILSPSNRQSTNRILLPDRSVQRQMLRPATLSPSAILSSNPSPADGTMPWPHAVGERSIAPQTP